MNREIALTIIIMILTIATISLILIAYEQSEVKKMTDGIIKSKISQVELTVAHVQVRMQYLTGIMFLASQTPTMVEPPNSNLVSEQLIGIPENAEVLKRKIAKDLVNTNFDLVYVFYSLPNGDIYFVEPFSVQIGSIQSNFAFRDWYKGVMQTGSTYISEAYVSANNRNAVVAIATPIYKDSPTGDLNGILVGALDLASLYESLRQVSLGTNEYLLVVDQNNNIVEDSRKTEAGTELEKVPLDFRGQSKGEPKTNVLMLDGKKVIVTFISIPIGTHEWLILSVQPYDDAFLSSIVLERETIGIIFLVVIITGIAGFFNIKKINANVMLSKKLERTSAAKDEFSAMVTHELKTPLVPIIGYCKMFKTGILGKLDDEQTSAIDVIEKNSKRLELLISDIMDARKLDGDKMRFEFDSLAIDDFLKNLSDGYKKTFQDREIDFVTKIDLNNIVINTDEHRLTQVLDNLINNAIKFVPKGNGVIEISGRKENDKVIIHVKDNGIGIPPDKQKNLFKKFYQIDTTERRPIGGTGLGLAISKGIMEKLGGSIWVESDGKTGTIFYLKLPIANK